jgi:predicted dehydrogenase
MNVDARRIADGQTRHSTGQSSSTGAPDLNIAIIGCGNVAAKYLDTLSNHPNLKLQGVADRNQERAAAAARQYRTTAYASNEDLLADPKVQLVVNLTNPESHYEVSKACLLAGKHVYSEKPFTLDVAEGQELVDLAERQGLLISGAPCSLLGETAQTMWKLVREGAIGRAQLVYAELDDNPIYLMHPEEWVHATGVPWPFLNEYATGCTLEHAGYHLAWLCAMFGPAKSVTAFASCLVPDKTTLPLDPPDAPDFSVACIAFQSGVVARLTCSIVAPFDHRFRVIGNEGVISVDECWQFEAPVQLERFSQTTLHARKSRTVRASSGLQALFGVGGRKQRLVSRSRLPLGKAWRDVSSGRRSVLGAAIQLVRRREFVSMDFFRGVADMAQAIHDNRRPMLPADFVLHVTELTLAVHKARADGVQYVPITSFRPLAPLPATLAAAPIYRPAKAGRASSVVDQVITLLHKH